MESNQVLKVENLVTSFTSEGRTVRAVNDVSFEIAKGRTLGIVGESGCGKSVTSLSLMQLVPCPPGKIERGHIWLGDEDLLRRSTDEMESVRGNRISMIFQEPMTALNPVFTVGNQVSESFIYHRGMSPAEALKSSIEILEMVGIPSPERRVHEYPHQLSGGMRQRVMIAIALACEPELLIADEPTTALDVTIQMQILKLMKDLQAQTGMSILFITHDLGVVAEMCDDVAVMYAGRIVEKASVSEIFKNPKHPYTKGLLSSLIRLNQERGQLLDEIKGTVPSLFDMPNGCAFHDRCSLATDRCKNQSPQLAQLGGVQGADHAGSHQVSCFKVDAND